VENRFTVGFMMRARLEGWTVVVDDDYLKTSSGLELEEGSGRTGLVSIMSEDDQFLGAGNEVGEEGGGVRGEFK
jgi:hypothetical protein